MKYLFSLLFAALMAVSAQAQLGPNGTGPRNPDDITRSVEMFVGCDSKVVTFDGTATGSAAYTLITKGKGLLCGVEINSGNGSNAVTAPFPLDFYDKASTSDVWLASTSMTDANKVCATQLGGPLFNTAQPTSLGGAYTATSMSAARNNTFRHPIKFQNGLVMKHTTGANYASVTVYWVK